MTTAIVPMTPERLAAMRRERCEHVNALLDVVRANGARFFEASPQRPHEARMYIDDDGRIRFVDDYNGRAILVTADEYSKSMLRLSHGSGLRWFVRCLGDYVRDGIQMHADDIGVHWGYPPAAIAAVRDAAVRVGFAYREESAA